MLIIDRTQRTWAAVSIATCAIASGVYVVYSTNSLNGPSGGSLPGLVFGIISAAMMVFAGLLAARRRVPAARLGSAQFWLRGHLWIGALTVPFALFHAGFGWGGRLELLLWVLFFAVILSGFWGLALQQILPRMMLEQIPRETFIEQIPHLCLRFAAETDCLLAKACGPLEVSLTPVELKQSQPHLLPYFEEDRKQNRNDYPRTAETEHYQTFLAKIYASVQAPARSTSAAAQDKLEPSSTAPAVKSVAHVTAPASPEAVPEVPAPSAEPAAAPAKPDAKAMLATMKAKKEAAAAAAVAAPVEAPVSPESATPAPVDVPAPVVPAKPDPKAMLAAMKAKKEAAAAEAAATASPPAEPPAPVASNKPDPKAMLAAMKAKKEAAAAAATAPPAEAPVVAEPTAAPASGKPDAKAMLAAMKAKKEAAAGVAPSPAAAPAAADQPNPLAALKPVKDPAIQSSAPLTAAAKVAPPSREQIAELRQFYLELIRPQLPLQTASRGWMESMRTATLACHIRRGSVHPQFVPIFERLHELCEQRRQLAFVLRYHRWLHGWLLVHIPATVALYAILVVHAVSALSVIPFGN